MSSVVGHEISPLLRSKRSKIERDRPVHVESNSICLRGQNTSMADAKRAPGLPGQTRGGQRSRCRAASRTLSPQNPIPSPSLPRASLLSLFPLTSPSALIGISGCLFGARGRGRPGGGLERLCGCVSDGVLVAGCWSRPRFWFACKGSRSPRVHAFLVRWVRRGVFAWLACGCGRRCGSMRGRFGA